MKALSSDSVNMSALCNERSTDFALVKDKETFWNKDYNSSARFRLADAQLYSKNEFASIPPLFTPNIDATSAAVISSS